jgi:hypothetical protein
MNIMKEGLSSDSDPEHVTKFGTFSIGDVIDGEIQKLGQFALRGKKSSGKAARKFVEEFTILENSQRAPRSDFKSWT